MLIQVRRCASNDYFFQVTFKIGSVDTHTHVQTWAKTLSSIIVYWQEKRLSKTLILEAPGMTIELLFKQKAIDVDWLRVFKSVLFPPEFSPACQVNILEPPTTCSFVVESYILRFGAEAQESLMLDPHHVIMEAISCKYSTNSPQTHGTLSVL